MRLGLISCGLPGPGYHGGAMACWAVLRGMVERGHEATAVSLYDVSGRNPYLSERRAQGEALARLGAKVAFVEYDHAALEEEIASRNRGTGPLARLRRALDPPLEAYFPWAALGPRLRELLEKLRLEAAFCYHFDALSAAAGSSVPILAAASDLFFAPAYFQWLRLKPGFDKYVRRLPDYLLYRRACGRRLLDMLGACPGRISFMPHYISWYRRRGLADMEYCPTPVHDPWDGKGRPDGKGAGTGKPRLLLIGDLGGTSAMSGLEVLTRETIPVLDAAFGSGGYEIHIVGAGRPSARADFLGAHPAVRLRGRVVPADEEFMRADVLLVPNSITLGVRVKIITAFSFATCVAAHRANAAGIPELVHGENCLLAGSGGDLARQAVRALADGALRARLAENGRNTYERFFHEGRAAGRIVDKLESLAGGRA